MDNARTDMYSSWVRGAATFILLHQNNPPMDAAKIAQEFDVPIAQVTREIERIVQAEQHKSGGVFEMALPPLSASQDTR